MAKKIVPKKKGQPSVKERLLSAADILFLQNGYSNTGIREIMKLAKVVPASFYDHFPSKQSLGEAYVQSQKEQMMQELKILANRFEDSPEKFLRTWGIFQKKRLEKKEFYGCQFASIAYQLRGGNELLKFCLSKVVQEWKKFLTEYFSKFISRSDAERMTDEMMIWIEGTYALWMISGDGRYIDLLNTKLKSLWTTDKS